MRLNITSRGGNTIIAACCVALLGFAFYQQYRAFLDPCPLCIFQRLAFVWIGISALAAAVHNPGRTGQKAYAVVTGVGAAFGAVTAGRHVWLQNLPADRVPECGPGLNYMLEHFPLGETLSRVFFGSGSCAEVHWKFLGLSMPGWTLIWFLALGGAGLWLAFTRR